MTIARTNIKVRLNGRICETLDQEADDKLGRGPAVSTNRGMSLTRCAYSAG